MIKVRNLAVRIIVISQYTDVNLRKLLTEFCKLVTYVKMEHCLLVLCAKNVDIGWMLFVLKIRPLFSLLCGHEADLLCIV